jgi:hypothetical protein
MADGSIPVPDDTEGKEPSRSREPGESVRREVGMQGEMNVGEICHDGSSTVYVQVWRGTRRPNPLGAANAYVGGVPVEDWPAIVGWLNAQASAGFSRRMVASNLTDGEALKIKATRIADHLAAGIEVINQLGPQASRRPRFAPRRG